MSRPSRRQRGAAPPGTPRPTSWRPSTAPGGRPRAGDRGAPTRVHHRRRPARQQELAVLPGRASSSTSSGDRRDGRRRPRTPPTSRGRSASCAASAGAPAGSSGGSGPAMGRDRQQQQGLARRAAQPRCRARTPVGDRRRRRPERARQRLVAHEFGHVMDWVYAGDRSPAASSRGTRREEALADMFAYDYDRGDATIGGGHRRHRIDWANPSADAPSPAACASPSTWTTTTPRRRSIGDRCTSTARSSATPTTCSSHVVGHDEGRRVCCRRPRVPEPATDLRRGRPRPSAPLEDDLRGRHGRIRADAAFKSSASPPA